MRRGDRGEGSGGASPRRRKSILRSFGFAWEGLSFVFNTQRHMRVHVAIMSLVLVAAWGLKVTTYELLHLLSAFALVLVTEMINTAIEQTVDLTIESYDPRAKVAKDVAAGAVMIAAGYAVVVGTVGVATSETFIAAIRRVPHPPPPDALRALQAALVGAILLAAVTTWIKHRSGRGTFWSGGIVSGHTALAFLVATTIIIVTREPAVACLAIALALLVAQSRLQADIHSPLEVFFGGVLGIIFGVIMLLPDQLG